MVKNKNCVHARVSPNGLDQGKNPGALGGGGGGGPCIPNVLRG